MTHATLRTSKRPQHGVMGGLMMATTASVLLALLTGPALARDERLSGKPGPKREMNCNITERIKNKNRSTTCVYKCPDGGKESASVDEGFSCPAVVNVLRK